MPDQSTWTLEEIESYARRHGLINLDKTHMERLRELADKAAQAGRELPRMPAKADEPAHTFRVPLT